jgi:putative glutamine amidotransferase
VVARAEDGLPEALEAPALPFVVGVQWHPEELAKTDQMSANLFYNFVEAAAGDWREQTPQGWREQFIVGCRAYSQHSGAPTTSSHYTGNGAPAEHAAVTQCA